MFALRTLTCTPEPSQPVTAWRPDPVSVCQSKDLIWGFCWRGVCAAFTLREQMWHGHIYIAQTEADSPSQRLQTTARNIEWGGKDRSIKTLESRWGGSYSCGGLIRKLQRTFISCYSLVEQLSELCTLWAESGEKRVFSEMLYGSVIVCKGCQLMSEPKQRSQIWGHVALQCW